MLCKISFLIHLAFYLHYKATITENTRKDAIFSLTKTKPAVKKISFLKTVICLKPIPKIIAQIFCLNNFLLQEKRHFGNVILIPKPSWIIFQIKYVLFYNGGIASHYLPRDISYSVGLCPAKTIHTQSV